MAAKRGRPCGPVLMRELATVRRGLFIRPDASSSGYSVSPVANPPSLSVPPFECLVGSRVSVALSLMLVLLLSFWSSPCFIRVITAFIAPLLVSTESIDIAAILASVGPKLLHN